MMYVSYAGKAVHGAPSTVGLPRMHKEPGERRDFLPDLVTHLEELGAAHIVLEHGYGSGMDIDPRDYGSRSTRVRFGSYQECLEQDLVLVLRCPSDAALERLEPGQLLVSMLHPRSRPERVELLAGRGVHAVSLDEIRDVRGRRLVEDFEAVGWNGVRAAFQQLERLHPHFSHPSRRPLRVTCLGSGAVGGYAVHAATRYGDPRLRAELVARNVPGVAVTVIDFDLTGHEGHMLDRLELTDLLIDATARVDQTRPVVPNPWIAALPEDAVILDLSADPYDFSTTPPRVKGIEGVPEGDLDQYIFGIDDPAYERLDARVSTKERRLALSCYSWPGLRASECMAVYGAQLGRVLEPIFAKPITAWGEGRVSEEEESLMRAEVGRWMRETA
jgi:alanine dehydrogenase